MIVHQGLYRSTIHFISPLFYNPDLRATLEYWLDHHTVQVVRAIHTGHVYLDDVHHEVTVALLVQDLSVVQVEGIQQRVGLRENPDTYRHQNITTRKYLKI